MADTYKRLAQTNTAAAGPTTVYTVPAATTAIVRKVVVLNPGVSAATVTLHHVEDGGSAGNDTLILPSTALQAGEHGVDEAPFVMEEGDFIAVQTDGTNSVTVHVYGLEIA